MTAGRLGKEQRAEARLLFFVFITIQKGQTQFICGRDDLTITKDSRRMGQTVCGKEFQV